MLSPNEILSAILSFIIFAPRSFHGTADDGLFGFSVAIDEAEH
jgi:hypothetical protein